MPPPSTRCDCAEWAPAAAPAPHREQPPLPVADSSLTGLPPGVAAEFRLRPRQVVPMGRYHTVGYAGVALVFPPMAATFFGWPAWTVVVAGLTGLGVAGWLLWSAWRDE